MRQTRPRRPEPASSLFLPNKRLGQHFLISQGTMRKIVAATDVGPKDAVLEIGPGRGELTRELAKRARAVVAVEKDLQLAEVLEKRFSGEGIGNVRIIRGDILKVPFDTLDLPKGFLVVANIPYYLTSRLIRMLLESSQQPQAVFLTVQKEVAERIVAKPPRMNLLAIGVQAYGTPKILFSIARKFFSPRPGVDSALIAITDISRGRFIKGAVPEELFFKVVRAAFRGKRKVIANSLSHNLGISKPAITAALAEARIDLRIRPESLIISQWFTLTHLLARHLQSR